MDYRQHGRFGSSGTGDGRDRYQQPGFDIDPSLREPYHPDQHQHPLHHPQQHQHPDHHFTPSSSSKRSMQDRDIDEDPQPKPRSKRKTEVGIADDGDSEQNGSGSAGPKRAAQACVRCRKQKLRCLGGWPCNRCSKAKVVCDFGRPGPGGGGAANARLEQLESSVANLLAGLAGGGMGGYGGGSGSHGGRGGEVSAGGGGGSRNAGPYPNGEILHTFDPIVRNAYSSEPRRYSSSSQTGSGPASWDHKASATSTSTSSFPAIPPPTHRRPLDPPRFGDQAIQAVSPEEQARHQVRFGSSPNVSFLPPVITSPSQHGSSAYGPSPGSAVTGRSDEGRDGKRIGKGQKAEERLAAATEGAFEPPFKALVYQPSVWDNREQSRRNSPQPSTQSRDEISAEGTYDKRFGREKDDPVNTEIVDVIMAEVLFNFFIEHCHPFLPIVNVALDDAFPTIRQAPPLISAMTAIAARFYVRFTARNPGAYPPLDPNAPRKLANLAESHLAQTLLRKQHALSDVQAIILLAAWGLQSGGRGPDSWVVTGHAVRTARRLGVHKILGQAAETARKTRPGTVEWETLNAFMPQWRTWLGWFSFDGFLSLGFGRPQSTQFETVDEQGFLQIRLNQPIPRPGTTQSLSLYGDVYIAGQVQLTQIGRDLVNWGEMLADPERAVQADPRRAEMLKDREMRVLSMFRELNGRLDEWCKLWVWSGSPYTLYLGSSARIARLQAEHMRLCLNSFALKSSPEQDDLIASFLKKALNAAMSTIQTHFESSQTDLALSFATDYLTITLAQAAIFLIRLTHLPPSVQKTINVESSVVAHYLQISIDLLKSGDMSETRLSTYLAKTIRDISRAAGIVIPGLGQGDEEAPSRGELNTGDQALTGAGGVHLGNGAGGGYGSGSGSGNAGLGGHGGNGISNQNQHQNHNAFSSNSATGTGLDETPFNPTSLLSEPDTGMPPSAFQLNSNSNNNNTNNNPNPFDLDNFLEIESQMDLSYLLGLPGDGSGFQFGGVQVGNGEGEFGGFSGEFGFGMGLGGMGMGIEGMGFDGGGFGGGAGSASASGTGTGSGNGNGTTGNANTEAGINQ